MCTIKPCTYCKKITSFLNIENIKTDEILLNIGHHYYRKNRYLMKKYYLMGINNFNQSAMINLGYYYLINEFNTDLMKKYYLMAIDKGNLDAMFRLGNYYNYIEKNYSLMKKYYLMGIYNGDSNSLNKLILYYKYKQKYNINLVKTIILLNYKFYYKYNLDNNFSDHIRIIMNDIKQMYKKYKQSYYELL